MTDAKTRVLEEQKAAARARCREQLAQAARLPNAPRSVVAQNYGTHYATAIEAGQVSDLMLTPGFYSLSSLSTVPYVSLIGSTGKEKVFSWGEIVEVTAPDSARVKNASYHLGDIFVNGGKDPNPLPKRVTVPVPFVSTFTEDPIPLLFKVEFPVVDVRRARAAWLYAYWQTLLAVNTTAIIEGRVKIHSHDSAPAFGMSGYIHFLNVAPLTTVFKTPLGFGSAFSDLEAQALLDTARLTIMAANASGSFQMSAPMSYYVLEY